MRIAIYQNNPEFGKVVENIAKFQSFLGNADFQFLVLPELAFTGYQFKDRTELESMAEEVSSSSTIEKMKEIAQIGNFHLLFGMPEKSGSCIYNSVFLVGPSGYITKYRKIHLFMFEKKIFTPGDIAFPVIDIKGVKVGISICFDWAFPEVTRKMALERADIQVLPANLVLQYCQKVMVARSIENRIFTLVANRIGSEERIEGDKLNFTGASQIVNPHGSVILSFPKDKEKLVSVDVDPLEARNKKITPFNDLLADRREEFY
ncbi:MAG: nitrilase-related carbon-nitrogen hydrolase [Pseudomonadota bacterium]